MRMVEAAHSRVVWAEDGAFVSKVFPDRGHRRRFEAERRVNTILSRRPTRLGNAPRLLGADRRALVLRFEAVEGEPLGPKFPLALADPDIDGMVQLANSMSRFNARTGRLRRMPSLQWLAAAERELLRRWLRDDPPRWVFAHGDITARNVVRRSVDDQLVLIDWEWAGIYPRGWDLAFLWFTLVDAGGARDRVASAVPARDMTWFWRSALYVTLLHLGLPWMATSPFRAKHEAVRDQLIDALTP